MNLMTSIIVGILMHGASPSDSRHFIDSVEPVLKAKCFSCHGKDKQSGGLRLDSLKAMLKGGDVGAAIVPGNLEKSLLIEAISFKNPKMQMPPKEKLSDKDIAALSLWVKQGAIWPENVLVLFDEDPGFPSILSSGKGGARIVNEGVASGKIAMAITPLQRENPKIPNWFFPIRENPNEGEFRYLRMAWKKKGEGGIMLELASNGSWPDAKVSKGRYVAGPNTTGWAAISVGEKAPSEWNVVTMDLWKDMGNFNLTGMAPTCDKGEEAYFDSIILGPSIASLDAYKVENHPVAIVNSSGGSKKKTGDAFTDSENPIRKIFKGERLDLWSLKAPVKSEIPKPKQDSTNLTNIDRFIISKMEPKGIAPSPKADKRTLIRRVTLGLTGLPPTPGEVNTFLVDTSPRAFENLVDRLLASQSYGEKWASHWLDIVRYADTNGYERDEFKPLAWQYRNSVIRAFNSDLPYDQFIRNQLAGDEMVASTPRNSSDVDKLLATGFLRLGQYDSTASIFQEESRSNNEQMADLVNTMGSAFLGITLSCCQCHDHKYDPFSQDDHYRFRAFFAAIKPNDSLVVESSMDLELINQHNSAVDREAEPLKKSLATLLEAGKQKVIGERKSKFPQDIQVLLSTAESSRDESTRKKLQPFLEKLKVNDNDARASLDDMGKKRATELQKVISETEAKKKTARKAMSVLESGQSAPATHVLFQGDHSQPKNEVKPGFLSVLNPNEAEIKPIKSNSTGRRSALADWIASRDNPFTARVIVNRVWQHHFGTGLVATPNDFGYSGARPTHPELLDWLSVEFMEQGWSVKKLQRMILLSNTYQQSSFQNPKNQALDPDNKFIWRQNVRRIDAETLRDSLLAISGLLNSQYSGKPIWPTIPEELLKAQPGILEAIKGEDGGRMQGWYADPVDLANVRSIYLVKKRSLPLPFLDVFDLPNGTISCGRRDQTVVAPQALMLLNSPESIRYAEALASKISKTNTSAQAGIEAAFALVLNRPPDADELALSLEFIRRHAEKYQSKGEAKNMLALRDFCRTLTNLNEFAYLD
jgi:hypothetical protein